jgi:hypothetical protein
MAIKIARKDKLVGGYNGNLESVIVHDQAGNPVATSNGVFVVLEGLMEGQREVKKARLATEADKAKDVLFIHNSEVMYDERKSKLEDFVIEAGKVARAYRLYDGDIVTLTVDLFAGAVAVGEDLVVVANGLIGNGVDETGAKVVFEVIEDAGNELHNTAKAFAVQVKRN